VGREFGLPLRFTSSPRKDLGNDDHLGETMHTDLTRELLCVATLVIVHCLSLLLLLI